MKSRGKHPAAGDERAKRLNTGRV